MTSDDLLNKIARPFVEHKQFFCGGMVVTSDRVQQVRFSKTEQSSKELAPFIEARRRMNGVVVFSPAENDVIWEGEDITREILETAEQRQEQKNVPAKAMTKSDRIFVVHGHDEAAVDQTEILIRRFGLTPIILRDAPSAGRTVIVICLYKGKVEIPSDLHGLITIHIADDVRDSAEEIRRELRAAGYEVP